jgi:hypothetical protein
MGYIRTAGVMDEARALRCAEWLNRVAEFGKGGYQRAALACEAVRGIVAVGEPEWIVGVMRFGEPNRDDWYRAIETYGPVATHAQRLAIADAVLAGTAYRAAEYAVIHAQAS